MKEDLSGFRSKGIMHSSGKIIKGCIRDATTKLSIGSIPSNYEAIVYASTATKGFGTSQNRFKQSNVTCNTLSYTSEPSQYSINKTNNVSYSIGGYGPLLSKVAKGGRRLSKTPGPGSYLINNQTKKIKRRIDFKSNLSAPKNNNFEKNNAPGPGFYEIDSQLTNQYNIGCKSSFVTKINRDGYIPDSITPGPGYYKNQIEKVDKRVLKISTQIKKYQDKFQTCMKIMIKKQKPKIQFPGPGTYNQDIPLFKPFYQKVKNTKNFILGPKDRFGNNEQQNYYKYEDNYGDDSPSPFSYQLKSNFNNQKLLINSPCFMSELKRQPFLSYENRLGPNIKIQQKQNKKRFHFNIRSNWL